MPSVKENIVVRKFITRNGEVLEETDWKLRPTDKCFYCDEFLQGNDAWCNDSQDNNHDWITLVSPSEFRR